MPDSGRNFSAPLHLNFANCIYGVNSDHRTTTPIAIRSRRTRPTPDNPPCAKPTSWI